MATVEQIQDDAKDKLKRARDALRDEWLLLLARGKRIVDEIDQGFVPDPPHLRPLQDADAEYREALAVYRALYRLQPSTGRN